MIAIVAILIGLLLPAVQKVREAAARLKCSNNLKQMGLAAHSANDQNGYMPRFGFAWPKNSTVLRQSSTFWSLLPHLEQDNLYKTLTSTSSGAFNQSTVRLTYVPIYICPSDSSGIGSNGVGTASNWNLNSYNVNGMVFYGTGYPALDSTFSDGTSNTVLFVEHIALCRNPNGGTNATDGRSVWPAVNLSTGDPIVYWPGITTTISFPGFPGLAAQYPTAMIPDPANGNVMSFKVPQVSPSLGTTGTCDPLTANSMHSGGVLVGLGDGSVRSVSQSITLRTWNAALTPTGGEVLGDDW